MIRTCIAAAALLAALGWPALGRTAAGQESPGQQDPVINGLGVRISQFLESVSAGQALSGYQALLEGSQLLKKTEALKALVGKTNELKANYGPYRAFERIGARRVGSDVVLLRYLYKCEHLPVVWYFTFYRSPAPAALSPEDDTWRVVALHFDTELDALWN